MSDDDEIEQAVERVIPLPRDVIEYLQEPEVRDFLRSPQTFILGTIVGFILMLWDGFLTSLEGLGGYVVRFVEEGVLFPVLEVIFAFQVLIDWWGDLAMAAGEITAEAGLLAPIGVVFVWAAGMIATYAVLLVLARAADTYLPISAMPILGRLIR